MNVLVLISCDFSSSSANSKQLIYSRIQQSEAWCHPLDSTWLVYDQLTPKQWQEKLKPYFRSVDRFLIAQISIGEAQGVLSKEVWDWLKAITETERRRR